MNVRRKNESGRHVAVLGGGAWGTTLAMLSTWAGNATSLYVRDTASCQFMVEERRHPRSLAGITLPHDLIITSDVESALNGADIVILAIPTQKLRSGIAPIARLFRESIIVSAAKGIEVGTLLRPSEIIQDVFANSRWASVCALSGPNLSSEIAAGKPATSVVASDDPVAASRVQNALMGETFRIYTSPDLVGVEMGGALKNIIAIGAGIGDGLDAGDNAKAAFLTRGIAEVARLGMAHGAQPLTFAGLSGIGDLIATCSSQLSRNHQVGIGLASGAPLADVLAGMTEVAEGVDTTRAAIVLARKTATELPIAEQMYQVMFDRKSPVDAVRDLMRREPKSELHGASDEF